MNVTIRLDQQSIGYFKSLADETRIPYQSLINLYLKDCVAAKKKFSLAWASCGHAPVNYFRISPRHRYLIST